MPAYILFILKVKHVKFELLKVGIKIDEQRHQSVMICRLNLSISRIIQINTKCINPSNMESVYVLNKIASRMQIGFIKKIECLMASKGRSFYSLVEIFLKHGYYLVF